MADIVIFIRGGVYQGAVSGSSNNRVMIVDYDDEAEVGHAQRHFEEIPNESDTFVRIVDGSDKGY